MQSKYKTHFKAWPKAIDSAVKFLNKSGKEKKILVEQNRNLGDTLHLIPVIRHYRKKFPDACIVFIVANPYVNAHVYNPDIDALYSVPQLDPQERIKLRKKMLEATGIQVVAPSIFPYSAVWKELTWSVPSIAKQYFLNAKIKDGKPEGGTRLLVHLTQEDKTFAENFVKKHKLVRNKTIAFEYNSYSERPRFKITHFKALVSHLNKSGWKCISFAGPKEGIIPGTIDARGLNWRKTVAILNHVGAFGGVGSGCTMLASACSIQPQIFELSVSPDITMKTCGYADSIRVGTTDPLEAANIIKKRMSQPDAAQKPKK